MSHTKKMKSRVIIVCALFLSIVIASAYLVHTHSKKKETIKIGYLPIYVDLPLFVAKHEGIFEKNGLEVELIRFQSSPDIASALVSGRIDMGASIATSSALVTESRDPGLFKIFLVDAETPENYLSSLVVASDSNIKNVTDLNGKKIGFFPGPTAKTFGEIALEKLGLPRTAYTYHSVQVGNHISSLESGLVDALVTYEPTATQAVMKYDAVKLVPGLVEKNVINPWQAGVWIVSKRLVNSDKKSSKLLIASIYEAVELIRNDPIYSKRALDKFTSISADVAVKTPNIPFTTIYDVDINSLQSHADILRKENVYRSDIAVDKLFINKDILK